MAHNCGVTLRRGTVPEIQPLCHLPTQPPPTSVIEKGPFGRTVDPRNFHRTGEEGRRLYRRRGLDNDPGESGHGSHRVAVHRRPGERRVHRQCRRGCSAIIIGPTAEEARQQLHPGEVGRGSGIPSLPKLGPPLLSACMAAVHSLQGPGSGLLPPLPCPFLASHPRGPGIADLAAVSTERHRLLLLSVAVKSGESRAHGAGSVANCWHHLRVFRSVSPALVPEGALRVRVDG
mmetsp:Transcript_14917/g.38232  ORF Transcript_14917/g.38232 Transcript_14917/m.38232 type:complete len:232 (+) Transcript_14917:2611-3306(+)